MFFLYYFPKYAVCCPTSQLLENISLIVVFKVLLVYKGIKLLQTPMRILDYKNEVN